MRFRVGYEFIYNFPQPTPMILTLFNRHPLFTRIRDRHPRPPDDQPVGAGDCLSRWLRELVQPDCRPSGPIRISGNGVVKDTGLTDAIVPSAQQHAVKDLPEETLVFLLGSRYCETDLLSPVAWELFAQLPAGWPLVQGICDYVHNHITFDYQRARSTRTAWEVYNDGSGSAATMRTWPSLCADA